jgi:uncharacterized repeat protein (TIGR01451 family)
VSPLNGHLYGYDSMTFDDKDVLVDMNPISNVASCTEIADPGNATGVLSTVMFSKQNKLVTIFANQTNGSWIDVNTGIRTILPSSVTAAPYSDGSSLPFAGFLRITKVGTPTDVIFENGFESINDNIFSNGFESAGFVDLDFIKSGVFVDTNDDMLAQAGESIEYSFSLSNTGSVALNSISISDPLMTVAGSLANLPVAATDNSTFSGTYVLTQTDVDNGEVSNLATANVQDPESNSLAVLSNSGVPLITNLATSAEVSLVKAGIFVDSSMDGFAQAGETIEYSFTVTNTGTQTLHNISITDPLLSISGSLASLSPSASDSITFSGTYILTQANVDNGFVSNLARVNSSDPSNNTVTSLSNNSTPLITNLPSVNSMSLIKSGVFVDTINDGAAGVGDKINYTFNVTNTGTQTLNNITISDALMSVPGAIPNLGVSASDSTTLKGNYVLKQADIDAGFVSNLATANAFDPSTNPISATSNAGSPLITNLSPTASISIVKSGSYVDLLNVGFVEPGDEIHYSFTVTNTGTQTLSAISISDPLVTVAGFLSSLAPSAIDSSTFSAVYTLTQDDVDATFVANTATVNAEDPSSSPISANSNNVVTNFTPTASISLVKSGVFADTNMDGLAQEGELINYAFVVKNTGSLTLSNISITDPKLSVAGSLASLAVSATDNSTFSGSYALTQVDIDAGFVSNLATVNAEDPSTNPVSASSNSGAALITNLPTNASMSLVKSAVFNDASMDGLAQVGETIDYSFTLTNTGNLTLTNLSISDPLMTVSGNLASLSVSTSDNSTFSGTYVLTQSDIDSGMVSNLATANATDPFMDPVTVQSNSGASLITNLPTLASMSLTKTGVFNDTNMDGFAQVGESIDYTFIISNTGNMTLTNISISDPKISVSGALASLAVSASDNSTFSGSYVLTQADIDAGFVSNLATANASDPALNLVTVQSNGGSATITNLPIFSCPEF